MFSYRDYFFGGTTFCFCIPVRGGVIALASVGLLLTGTLSIAFWFEVSNVSLSSGQKAAFIIAALVETALFFATILGFAGAIVRMLKLVQTFAYFLYVHLVLSIAVAFYLAYAVTHFTSVATLALCQQVVQNEQAKAQCDEFLNIAAWVYIVGSVLVVIGEIYGAIVVTRYVNQLKKAGTDRTTNSSLLPSRRYIPLSGAEVYDGVTLTSTYYTRTGGDEFNPYLERDDVHREDDITAVKPSQL